MHHGLLSANGLIFVCLCVVALARADDAGEACRPWSSTGPACAARARLDLRFIVDLAAENYVKAGAAEEVRTAVFGFAPEVDRLQLFNLSGAAALAAVQTTSKAFSADPGRRYLSVYGFGNANRVGLPEPVYADAAAVLVERDLGACGGSGTAAVATTLLLDVGLHQGFFNYEGDAQSALFSSALSPAPGPNLEAMAKLASVKRPLQTGFVATCGNTQDGERCLLDREQICIGDQGHRNCARCYKDAAELASSAKVSVVVSYYGTDSKGRTLTSGTRNPFNFRAFGRKYLLKDLQKVI